MGLSVFSITYVWNRCRNRCRSPDFSERSAILRLICHNADMIARSQQKKRLIR